MLCSINSFLCSKYAYSKFSSEDVYFRLDLGYYAKGTSLILQLHGKPILLSIPALTNQNRSFIPILVFFPNMENKLYFPTLPSQDVH